MFLYAKWTLIYPGAVDAYDMNGNILSLMRSSSTGGMDGFRYEYNGNQLTKLYPDWDDDSDFVTYNYDANGNCIFDGTNLFKTDYNLLNLTAAVYFPDMYDQEPYDTAFTKCQWLADGTKAGYTLFAGLGSFEYLGSMKYLRVEDEISLYDSSFGGGRFLVSEGPAGKVYTPHYYITDHLGSNRAIVADGQVADVLNYYPYGSLWESSGYFSGTSMHHFNGKEEFYDALDYGARMYVPNVPRWTSIDPLAEKYYSVSPYAYCANNPIIHIDPNGKEKLNHMDKKKKEDEPIHQYAEEYEDDDAIHIFAHGNRLGLWVYNAEGGMVFINTVEDFEEFLSANSKTWQNQEEGDAITIILHSCNTGMESEGEGTSFASKISEFLTNVAVIAPDGLLQITSSGGEIKDARVVQPSSVGGRTNTVGKWVEFRNGKQVNSRDGTQSPRSFWTQPNRINYKPNFTKP